MDLGASHQILIDRFRRSERCSLLNTSSSINFLLASYPSKETPSYQHLFHNQLPLFRTAASTTRGYP